MNEQINKVMNELTANLIEVKQWQKDHQGKEPSLIMVAVEELIDDLQEELGNWEYEIEEELKHMINVVYQATIHCVVNGSEWMPDDYSRDDLTDRIEQGMGGIIDLKIISTEKDDLK